MPWKNGRGETIEIALSPHDATIDSFDWRISVATVGEDGPFSLFPGIDRTLLVLSGAGMELSGPASGRLTATPDAPPVRFAGEEPLQARLIDGPTVDFNVMTRRERAGHNVRRLPGGGEYGLAPEAGTTTLVFAPVGGAVVLPARHRGIDLAAYDCFLVTGPAGLRVAVESGGAGALVVDIMVNRAGPAGRGAAPRISG